MGFPVQDYWFVLAKPHEICVSPSSKSQTMTWGSTVPGTIPEELFFWTGNCWIIIDGYHCFSPIVLPVLSLASLLYTQTRYVSVTGNFWQTSSEALLMRNKMIIAPSSSAETVVSQQLVGLARNCSLLVNPFCSSLRSCSSQAWQQLLCGYFLKDARLGWTICNFYIFFPAFY